MRASLVLLGFALLGCQGTAKSAATQGPTSAKVEVKGLGASTVHGTLTIEAMGDGAHFMGKLEGLPPNSTHGFHVHENGDCSAADGSSAGGHYNPAKVEHGAPHATSHGGDLGNIEADDKGVARVSIHKDGVTVAQLIGKGVIVHAQPDDLKTQPTGNSGARIGCGVIH
jgi:Cu-Zn family superoxide dismutase